MDTVCREWKGGKVKLRFMCGIHDCTVGIRDGDRTHLRAQIHAKEVDMKKIISGFGIVFQVFTR